MHASSLTSSNYRFSMVIDKLFPNDIYIAVLVYRSVSFYERDLT
jgi:hypothetical protein